MVMIIEVMRHRRSIRKFRSEPLPRELLARLVEAAGLAPSAENKQPWRFIVVEDHDLIDDLAREIKVELQALQENVDPDFASLLQDHRRHFFVFEGAPALVVPLFRPVRGLPLAADHQTSAALRDSLNRLERDAALISVSMAMQNLLLAAAEAGVGACLLTAPLIAAPRLASVLEVPTGWEIAALIAVGYPDEDPPDPGRKSVPSILKWKVKE